MKPPINYKKRVSRKINEMGWRAPSAEREALNMKTSSERGARECIIKEGTLYIIKRRASSRLM
jgi:hypothetical protein